MLTASIQLIAPTVDIAVRARSVSREMGMESQLECHVANLGEGLDLAVRLEERGAEVFIARRGTADLIQRHLPTPLVQIPVTLQDMTQALAKARGLTGMERPKVAFFGMPALDEELAIFAELLNFELRLYHVSEREEHLSSTLVTAMAEGADVVVAGGVVTRMAQERGIASVMLDSGPLSLRQALSEAKGIAYARTLEKSQNERFRAVVDNSSDGVIVLDESRRVQMVNPAALRILGRDAAALGVSGSVLLPGVDVSSCYAGETTRNAVVDSPRGALLLNMTPTRVGGKVGGAILSFVPAESIVELGAAIHKTRNARGFVSRFGFSDILGGSPQIIASKEKALAYAARRAPVLLAGETGTGKELFAHAIHRGSPYSRGPFVTVNCASLPPTLLESELFGYEEGAFTGAARKGKPGLFELAHKGTLFLDEISALDLHGQVRLLRFLQEQTIMRVGGNTIIPLDLRVVAAANRNLWEMVSLGAFRKDLFFRLNVLPVFIPPLRDRTGDVELLASHALLRFSSGKMLPLESDALEKLRVHSWPGNVRELLNVMERYAVDGASLGRAPDIGGLLNPDLQWAGMAGAPRTDVAASPKDNGERARLLDALEANGWNQGRTAAQLGINRTTLYRKMRLYGLRKHQ